MQNLIVGEVYTATLNNEYYKHQSVTLRYLGLYDEEDESVKRFSVMEDREWEGRGIVDGSGKWFVGETAQLHVEGYTFEPVNFTLENE